MKQLVLVGVLTGAIAAAPALVAAQKAAGTVAGQKVPRPDAGPVTSEAIAPGGELALGSVRLSRGVKADGKPLAAGTYQVRLTPEEAKPPVAGQTEQLERWVEFVQRGEVKGREVVSIVPQNEIGKVAEDAPPRAGGHKVQMLKGNDYIRLWINKAGTHYLVHFPPA